MEKQHIDGATVVKSEPLTPVMITRFRTVGGDRQVIELQLEQMFPPPLVNSTTGILAWAMDGHSAYNSGARKRICWQNFSTKKLIEGGIITKWEDVGESEAEMFDQAGQPQGVRKGILLPKDLKLTFKDPANNEIPFKIIVVDTFTGRTWKDPNTLLDRVQQPRRAGLNGDILTRGGKPIFRNAQLSMPGNNNLNLMRAWDEDYIIVHDNAVVGSTVRAAMAAADMPVGQPQVPAGVAAQQADPALQNRGIGQTSNLVHGAPEPTRTTPDQQTQEVAEKTKAEELREAGERPVESQPQHD